MRSAVVEFEGLGLCFYERHGFRRPRRGEFYLSGAVTTAYRAPNDLDSCYTVVVPTHRAQRCITWEKGEEIHHRVTRNGHTLAVIAE
jgi:hypothetical protein